MCRNFRLLQALFPIREKRGASPIFEKLLPQAQWVATSWVEKKGILWKSVSQANRKSTLGNLSWWLSSSSPLSHSLQVTIDNAQFCNESIYLMHFLD